MDRFPSQWEVEDVNRLVAVLSSALHNQAVRCLVCLVAGKKSRLCERLALGPELCP